ncbi:hypothetical protein Pcinc_020389 [Petrolisthes cinctipes]|uniref:Uncharacterized protein n=1 Tax=Petrolisthes cinctipes TaxID=88211 RepID=A0AAE1FI80_PETCI|nr:hypothetical protein Pcinc_020389 [Petrolisthes cinctipes]
MRESHCLMFLGPLSTHTQYKVNIVLQFAVKDTRESERERRMKNERRQPGSYLPTYLGPGEQDGSAATHERHKSAPCPVHTPRAPCLITDAVHTSKFR